MHTDQGWSLLRGPFVWSQLIGPWPISKKGGGFFFRSTRYPCWSVFSKQNPNTPSASAGPAPGCCPVVRGIEPATTLPRGNLAATLQAFSWLAKNNYGASNMCRSPSSGVARSVGPIFCAQAVQAGRKPGRKTLCFCSKTCKPSIFKKEK